MLDVSFGEFILVLLVAMAFLGPERIPVAARKLGEWTRAVRDAFLKVREDVTADPNAAEAFTQMQQTMQEISQAVSVRHVVRELGAPLMTPLEKRPGPVVPSDKPEPSEPSEPSDKPEPSDLPPMAELRIDPPADTWTPGREETSRLREDAPHQPGESPRLAKTFHLADSSDDQSV
jgi:sec-independent protein translocase protein TatB